MAIFKLKPSCKDYLWGGRRLNDEFEKGIDLSPLAETWEWSTHPEGPCYVVGGEYDGKELAAVLREHPEYLGERHKGETELPILIKFIDAKKDLSVQVLIWMQRNRHVCVKSTKNFPLSASHSAIIY